MKILFFGERVTSKSGFAWLNRHILKALHEAGHEVHAVLWVYRGLRPIDFRPDLTLDENGLTEVKNALPYRCYPLSYEGEYWGANRVEEYIRQIKPDVILAHGDPQHLQAGGMGVIEQARKHEIPLVAYVAIDGENHRDWTGQNFNMINFPVVYTHWAREVLCKEFEGYPFTKVIRTIYPPHKLLHWIEEEERKQLKKDPPFKIKNWEGKEFGSLEDKKIILAVGRNTQRKAHARLIRAVRLLKNESKRDDFVVIFHTNPRAPTTMALDLIQLTLIYGVDDKVIFTFNPDPAAESGIVTDAALNLLYGMADIHVMSSKREGFGLPLIEAAMSGTASITTNYASMAEVLADERGWLVPFSDFEHCPEYNLVEALVNVPELAKTINHALDHPEECREKATALKVWTKANCDPARVRNQWVKLFEEIERSIK